MHGLSPSRLSMLTLLTNQQITLLIVLVLFLLSLVVWFVSMVSVIRKQHHQVLLQLMRFQTALFKVKQVIEVGIQRLCVNPGFPQINQDLWNQGSEQPLNIEQLITLYQDLKPLITFMQSQNNEKTLQSCQEQAVMVQNQLEHLQANLRMAQAMIEKFNAKLVRFPSVLIANALDIEPYPSFPK